MLSLPLSFIGVAVALLATKGSLTAAAAVTPAPSRSVSVITAPRDRRSKRLRQPLPARPRGCGWPASGGGRAEVA